MGFRGQGLGALSGFFLRGRLFGLIAMAKNTSIWLRNCPGFKGKFLRQEGLQISFTRLKISTLQ